jgi:hypothetical protein
LASGRVGSDAELRARSARGMRYTGHCNNPQDRAMFATLPRTADPFHGNRASIPSLTCPGALHQRSRRPFMAWALSCLALGGCVTSHVIVGKVRPAISPSQVQLYLHPPSGKYEEIAILDTSSKHSFSITAQGKTDAVIDRLKSEAAKLGANGILLNNVGDQAVGSVGTGVVTGAGGGHASVGVGVSTTGTVFQKSGNGVAIYVEPGTP